MKGMKSKYEYCIVVPCTVHYSFYEGLAVQRFQRKSVEKRLFQIIRLNICIEEDDNVDTMCVA